MNQEINLKQVVYEVVNKNPELVDLLVDLGFKPLKNPVMLNSIGRTTTITQGAKLLGLSTEDIKQTLEWNGYTVTGDSDN